MAETHALVSINRAKVFVAVVAMLLIRAVAWVLTFQPEFVGSPGGHIGHAFAMAAQGLVHLFPVTITLVLILGSLLTIAARRVVRGVADGVPENIAVRNNTWLVFAVLGVFEVIKIVLIGAMEADTGEAFPAVADVYGWLGAVLVAYPVLSWALRPRNSH